VRIGRRKLERHDRISYSLHRHSSPGPRRPSAESRHVDQVAIGRVAPNARAEADTRGMQVRASLPARAGRQTIRPEVPAEPNEELTMVIAADYPFMDVMWSMVVFFAFVVWLFIMVAFLTDIFRRRDISGWAKAAWTVFLIVLPFVGVITYLVINHHGLAVRSASDTKVTEAQVDYLKGKTNGGAQREIEMAKELLDSGAITPMEFDAIKAKVIA